MHGIRSLVGSCDERLDTRLGEASHGIVLLCFSCALCGMAMVLAEPPKRRRHSEMEIVSGLVKSFEAGEQMDFDYVLATLKAEPKTTKYIARVLRSGAVHKAMLKTAATELAAELGKRLGEKAICMAGCTKSFKFQLLMLLTSTHRDAWELWDDVPDERIAATLAFGLAMRQDSMLPYTHARSEYGGPMMALLAHRHHELGLRLVNLTPARAMSIGYFAQDSAGEPLKIYSFLHKADFDLPFSIEFMRKASDWMIDLNAISEAKLVSTTLAVDEQLVTLAISSGMVFVNDNVPFEYPSAAMQFEQFALAVKEEAANIPGVQLVKASKKKAKVAAKKSAGRAKAKAKSSRRPNVRLLDEPASMGAAMPPIADA